MPQKTSELAFLLALSGRFAADRDDLRLQALFDALDWFRLRDSVEDSANVPAFYRGAVACAFNDLDRAQRAFRSVIATPGNESQAIEAHGLLAHAYM